MARSPQSLPLVALALAVAVMVAQARVIIGGETWSDTAYHTAVMPPRLAAATAVHAGMLPSWWDGVGLGVPLGAEPRHGAWSPLAWIATTPRGFDLVGVLLLWWAALGVAVWSRRRGASEPAALVAGLLIATSGVAASGALRGALPALAMLPWLGAAAHAIGDAQTRREAASPVVALGLALGLVALTGELALLVDGLALAAVVGARRTSWRWLAAGLAAGLAIGAAQWVPAVLHLGTDIAGASLHALPLPRLLELLVPGSFGAVDPDHAVAAVAGTAAWAPSLYVGAPLFALAAVQSPARRVLGLVGALIVAALVVGRGGGWPSWLGAPELHLAVLAIVLAPYAALGLGELARGDRRATLAIVAGAVLTMIALGALAVLRATRSDAVDPVPRALLDGGLGVVCMIAAAAIGWRVGGGRRVASGDSGTPPRVSRWMPVILALVVAPSIGASPSVFPVAGRAIVDDEPAWATLAAKAGEPRRFFRPPRLVDTATPAALDDAIATLAGTSAARWGLDEMRTDDPARPAADDAAWLASASAGFNLLDRYGVGLVVFPSSRASDPGFTELGQRGDWALLSLPVAPPAAVMRGWSWAHAPKQAYDLMFPEVGTKPISRGSIVLDGAGESRAPAGPPAICRIQHWLPGDLDLLCTSAGGWAVVSSSPAPGWRAEVDGAEQPWRTADVLRRAVEVGDGIHHVRWIYAMPGVQVGGMLALFGLLALAILWTLGRRRQ